MPSPGQPDTISSRIRDKAGSIGFDLVGIAPANPSRYRDYFLDWLSSGRAGDMHYLRERFAERVDPAVYLPGVQSVICVALNYHVPLAPAPSGSGRIARYAQGDDYHLRLKPMLYALADWLRGEFPSAVTRCGTDSAPIMERELAARAGIGWVGKNTCVIHPKIGSWILLGEVLTTLDLPADESLADRCGTCTRCLDACPTDALHQPYQLDATRCISYLTIEHPGPIEQPLADQIGDWIFGCDICQDVCPYNTKAPATAVPWLQPRIKSNSIDATQVADWSTGDYHAFTRRSAVRRIKLPILQRNAAIAMANNQRSQNAGDPV